MFLPKEDREQFRENDSKTPVTKLSQAIREGCKYHPQGKQFYLHHGRTCALGAAWEGLYGPEKRESRIYGHSVLRHFGVPPEMFDEIAKRNDSGMTREAIADWLEAQGL